MTDHKRPLWPWIATLLIGLPVLYVASFGPVCWWIEQPYYDSVVPFYWPIGRTAKNGPEFLQIAINWYATLGIEAVSVNTDSGHFVTFIRSPP